MSQRVIVRLNNSLLIQQGVTEEQEKRLVALHNELHTVLENPFIYDDPVKLVEEIEYDLQENWNFNLDKNKHSHWYRLKGCTCPKLDNKSYWGTKYRITDPDCMWHGVKDVYEGGE